MTRGVATLRRLARAHGVNTAYTDALGTRRVASAEVLLSVLRALGAPVTGPGDAAAALRERELEPWERIVEPVCVATPERRPTIEIRLRPGEAARRLACSVRGEDGTERTFAVRARDLPTRPVELTDGTSLPVLDLTLPRPLPTGYHRLHVEVGTRSAEGLLVCSPARAFAGPGGGRARSWGVFLPLYALHRERSWGHGDLADLEALVDWSSSLGARVVGTLPLLASFLDEPYDPSPYAPVSRLFWNELFLDVTSLPELDATPEARRLLETRGVLDEVRRLRESSRVDYRRAMALRRRVLEPLAETLVSGESPRRDRFRAFLAERPDARDYARFRSLVERHRTGWRSWPARLRDGAVRSGDVDRRVEHYHLYVQWAMEEQLAGLADRAAEREAGLYLDFPLGVHADGYDVWRERAAFVEGVSAGAPPDGFFTRGQDWGFPPLHPREIRRQGHRYLTACIRQHMRHARALRIDHVMGLHRLFWIPAGCGAADGVYVRYPAEELYAILALESVRARCEVVGEDLGTVPRYVRPAMRRRGVRRMYVLQYEAGPDPATPVRSVPEGAVASLNTHDMPTFAAFWRGLDVADRVSMGLLDRGGAREERERRRRVRRALFRYLGGHVGREGTAEALRRCLAYLASGGAGIVLINLEDLWLETAPQNVPGTGAERPNWQRRSRHALEAFSRRPDVLRALRLLDRATRERGNEDDREGPRRGTRTKVHHGKGRERR